MKWNLMDNTHVILAICDAMDKDEAIAKLKPQKHEFVMSAASTRQGYPPRIADALQTAEMWCTLCRQSIKRGDGVATAKHHWWCHNAEMERRHRGR